MFRKVSVLAAGMVLGAAVIFGVTQQALVTSTPAQAQTSDTYRQLNLFGDIFERILADYVDEKTDQELIQAAIHGMIEILDPHSQYYTQDQFQAFQADLTGQFGGLGLEVTKENGAVHVVTPIDGTPAAAAGVLAGDEITAINGEDTQDMTLDEAVDLMRGDPGTDITITIRREGLEDQFNVTITRAIIHAPQVRTKVFGNIAYIRLTVFGTQTQGEFIAAIDDLIAEIGGDNITGFILDLRNNGGGSLDTAISIADDFLERGEIVSTRGRNPQDTQRYDAHPGDEIDGRPMIVLVNGGSASASEILAGALQDHRRATIIGTQSYGKGSVQTIFPLGSNLGAIRLTTARYYTPSGRSIQDVGITPDIMVEQPLPQSMLDLMGPDMPVDDDGNPITTFDVIPLDAEEDTQLQFALQLMRGEITDPAYPPPPEANLPN